REATEKLWPDAVAAMNAAVWLADATSPGSRAALLVQRGQYHLFNGEATAARDDWRTALDLDAGSTSAARLLGRLLALGPAEVRDPAGVLPLLARLEDQGQSDAEWTLLHALVNARRGHLDPADVEAVRGLTSVDPWRSFAAYVLALAYHGQGDTKLAAATLN